MSFGFSIGDFIAVIEIAINIRKQFVEAPAQFKAISDEVRSLSVVVQDVEVDLSTKELSSQQQDVLRQIEKSCRDVLTEIEEKIEKYKELKSDNGTKRKLVTRVWKRLKWEPDDIRDLRTRVTSNINILNAFNGRITRKDVTKLVHLQDNQEREAILDWVSPVTYTKLQSDYLSRRQTGTGQWLLSSPEFQSWVEMPKQTLLCPGIPGAGKTILTSIVVEELNARYKNNSDIGVAYLYFDYKRQEEQKFEFLLASLLRQLLQGQKFLPADMKAHYDQHRKKRTQLSLDEISQSLHSLSGNLSQLFIVIDALDECRTSDRSRTRILDEIFHLQAEYDLHFLATTRFIPEITAIFEGKPSLEISASKEDVMIYLMGHLVKLPAFVLRSAELQNEIATGITEAVDGIFLLAQLHLDSLMGKRSPKAMRSALKNLSTISNKYDSSYDNAMERVYDSAYDDAMKRIARQFPDQTEMAKQVLSWVTLAKRQLTTTELQNALAVEADGSDLDKDNLPDLEDMVSVCAGLITVDAQSDIIRLVHYTTQEYFQRTWTSWFPNAERDIASICITYLSFDCFQAGPCSRRAAFSARLQQYPFYFYASKNWGDHNRAQPVHEEMVIRFLKDIPKAEASVQSLLVAARSGFRTYSHQAPPQIFTGVHLAAYFGLEDVMEQLMRDDNQIDVLDPLGRTPLSWAAYNGHVASVQLLLSRGNDPNTKDGRGRTPLSLAAHNGRHGVAQLLLEKGAGPDSKDTHDRAPLSWAVINGHEAVVQLLLGQGVQPDSKDNYGRTPLSWAAYKGHEAVVQLLLGFVPKLVQPPPLFD